MSVRQSTPPKPAKLPKQRQSSQENRSGEGAASALERLRILEKAKAATQPAKQKRTF